MGEDQYGFRDAFAQDQSRVWQSAGNSGLCDKNDDFLAHSTAIAIDTTRIFDTGAPDSPAGSYVVGPNEMIN